MSSLVKGLKRSLEYFTGGSTSTSTSTSTSMEGTTPKLDDVNLIVYLEDTRGYKGFEHTIKKLNSELDKDTDKDTDKHQK